ncbi:MAG: L-threonylcarbamoyladenylate synthase [Anaerolineae bacterium]|nr:L-threonylcarbamoyladenylate synthase [Anaerolineae bacterium]
MTDILPAYTRKAIRTASRLLQEGEVVAFPTDTVYGLGANAFERYAVRQIYELKRRPRNQGLPVFIYQIDDLNLVATGLPNAAWPLLQKFWPGALTVVLPKSPKLPDDVTGGNPTVAVRVPDHPVCLDLVIKTGRPIIGTSANLSGYDTPTTAQGVADQLGEDLLLVLDGGPSPSSLPSTLIDLSVSPPRLLRQGPITVDDLRPYLPDLEPAK